MEKIESKLKIGSKINKFVSGSKYYKWRHSWSKKYPIVLIIGDFIFLLTLIATILTIKDSCINSYQRKYQSDKAAVEYYRIGEKYYLDKNYEEALNNFEKVYNINKHLFDTKYYYTMSMLKVDQSENSMLARKILLKTLNTSMTMKKGYMLCWNVIKKIMPDA